MMFKNYGEGVKIRIGSLKDFRWITIKKLGEIELEEKIGLSNGLKKIESVQGMINDKIVETKIIDNIPKDCEESTSSDVFFKELVKIKGIGKKTAKDIMSLWTKEELREQIKLNKSLPLRDDIVEKLVEKYGC